MEGGKGGRKEAKTQPPGRRGLQHHRRRAQRGRKGRLETGRHVAVAAAVGDRRNSPHLHLHHHQHWTPTTASLPPPDAACSPPFFGPRGRRGKRKMGREELE